MSSANSLSRASASTSARARVNDRNLKKMIRAINVTRSLDQDPCSGLRDALDAAFTPNQIVVSENQKHKMYSTLSAYERCLQFYEKEKASSEFTARKMINEIQVCAMFSTHCSLHFRSSKAQSNRSSDDPAFISFHNFELDHNCAANFQP